MSPYGEAVRCRPEARPAEFRAALFHGRNLAGSVLVMVAAVVATISILVERTLFTAMILVAALCLVAALFLARPADIARKSAALEWAFSPQGLSLSAPGVTSSIAWRHVACVVAGRRSVLFHLRASGRVAPIPRRCLAPDDVDRILRWARDHGVDVRGPRSRPWR
jgi:hypothetical protein